jgi:hypothetical protein
MSVKFEKETVMMTEGAQKAAADMLGGKGKTDLMGEVGKAMSKGGVANGYLAVRVAQLLCDDDDDDDLY